MLDVDADQLQRGNHWIAVRDPVLALPISNRIRQWIVRVQLRVRPIGCGVGGQEQVGGGVELLIEPRLPVLQSLSVQQVKRRII